MSEKEMPHHRSGGANSSHRRPLMSLSALTTKTVRTTHRHSCRELVFEE